MEWLRVSKVLVCPICGKGDWCSIGVGGEKAICMRTPSSKECKSGGWYHKLKDITAPIVVDKPEPKIEDFTGIIPAISTKHINELAAQLGLTATSLRKMGVGYDRGNYLFPMKNADEKVIGVRVRNKDGKKWSIKGSRNGLFIPVDYLYWSIDTLYICEGATDCAALLDLGFEAIGRPSCSGGTSIIKKLLVKKKRHIIIVSDNDEPKQGTNGIVYCPGQEGAARLAREIKGLCYTIQIVKPPVKDIRQWLVSGAKTEDILRLVI